jgi:UDP-N-acetylmuramoyl-tripeptide--D-alanyl-D-alanine ligase
MQIETRGKSKFILDAYNANPSSMKAAITGLRDKSNPRPLVAVLGDMRELGAYSKQYHDELGKWLAGLDIDRLFLAGPEMRYAYDAALAAGAGGRCAYAPTPEGWIEKLAQLSREGGTFLIKASRAMEFKIILDKL